MTRLLAAPNFSEGRDLGAIDSIAAAFGTHLIDIHADPDHHRSVFTLVAAPGELAEVLVSGARVAAERIDLSVHRGLHPRVGALDVAPVIFPTEGDRGAACAEALVIADRLADELGIAVFLYGILGEGRTRAELRAGGTGLLQQRMEARELTPDFGPPRLHRTAGATLVAARPPLIAFNVELEPPAGEADAKRIAALIREGGGEGLKGVRAIGLWLERRQRAQVSTNVEDHLATPLAAVLAAVASHATVAEAELVGLAPRAAFDGFPPQLPIRGKRVLEDVL